MSWAAKALRCGFSCQEKHIAVERFSRVVTEGVNDFAMESMFRGRQPLLDECMACYRQLRPNFRCRRSILTYHFSVCSVSID
jgi:hypothetical protein